MSYLILQNFKNILCKLSMNFQSGSLQTILHVFFFKYLKKAYLNVKRPCGILRKKLRIQGSFVRLTRVQQIKILTACVCVLRQKIQIHIHTKNKMGLFRFSDFFLSFYISIQMSKNRSEDVEISRFKTPFKISFSVKIQKYKIVLVVVNIRFYCLWDS